jgi:hypothetical protein
MSDNGSQLPVGPAGGDTIRVGPDHRSQQISMQVVQDLYNEFTGKTEQLSGQYSVSFKIDKLHIDQLDKLIEQLCEPYNICVENCTITIFHRNQQKQQISSYQKFSDYNQGILNATESVLLVYDFLVSLPESKRVKSYKVTIKLSSRVAIEKKLREERGSFNHALIDDFFQLMGGQTATITIDYIDCVVARAIRETFVEWIHGLPTSTNDKALKKVKQYTHLIPRFLKYAISAFVLFVFLKLAPNYIGPKSDFVNFYNYSLLTGALIFFSFRVAKYFGHVSENAIDSLFPLSYIKLNRGDESLIDENTKQKKVLIIKACFGIIADIVVGIIAIAIAKKFGY